MNLSTLCTMLAIPRNSTDGAIMARVNRLANSELRASVAHQVMHRMRAVASEDGKAKVGGKVKVVTGPLSGMSGIVIADYGKIGCYEASLDSGMDGLKSGGLYRICADQIEIDGKVSDNGAVGDAFVVLSGGFAGCKGVIKSALAQQYCYDVELEQMDGMPIFPDPVRICDDQIEVVQSAEPMPMDEPEEEEMEPEAKFAVGDSVKFRLSDSMEKIGKIEAIKPKCVVYSISVDGEGVYQWSEDGLEIHVINQEDEMTIAELQAENAALRAELDAARTATNAAQNGEIAALLRLEHADNSEASMGVLVSSVKAAMSGGESPVSITDAVNTVKASLPRLFLAPEVATPVATAEVVKTPAPATPAAPAAPVVAPGSLRARAVGALPPPPPGAMGKPVSRTQEFATPQERAADDEAKRLASRRMS